MKIDLHVHTSEVSYCGHLTASETIKLYKQAGYDCIVITNHFESRTARMRMDEGADDFAEYYLQMYERARKEGEDIGLLVLNGYEIRFNCNHNDYLVYGMSDKTAHDYNALFELKPAEFYMRAKEEGFLFYQAHPFRNGMYVNDPSSFFGIEVKNGNADHDSRNDIANMWADKYSLHKIAGSDCHRATDAAKTGIKTDYKVKNIDDLVYVLREDNYEII